MRKVASIFFLAYPILKANYRRENCGSKRYKFSKSQIQWPSRIPNVQLFVLHMRSQENFF